MNPNKKLESPDATIAANAASEKQAISSTIFCLVVLAIGLPQLVVTYREMTTGHFVLQIAAMLFVVGVVAYSFLLQAAATKLGVKGYLLLEGRFLTRELPSIVQFVSLLSLVNIFLQNTYLRIYITLFITLLLYFYLSSKREEYLQKLPKNIRGHIYRSAIIALSAVVCITLWTLVFGMASLMSFT